MQLYYFDSRKKNSNRTVQVIVERWNSSSFSEACIQSSKSKIFHCCLWVLSVRVSEISTWGFRNWKKIRDKVEAQGKFRTRGRAPGNENRRWHGTKRECNIGEGGQVTYCASATCALCRILSSSFNMTFCVRGACVLSFLPFDLLKTNIPYQIWNAYIHILHFVEVRTFQRSPKLSPTKSLSDRINTLRMPVQTKPPN